MAISRRKALKTLGAVPVAAGFTWTAAEAAEARQKATTARKTAATAKTPFKPAFFTPHEWAMVKLLVDLIIPKDERSGSATDAGVPEFMDFMMTDAPTHHDAMRGGLHWLDTECLQRFGKTFVDCTPADRTALLDAIAWPAKASPLVSQGVAFFSGFRDMTASGFWSSKMGVEDLQYMGNVPNPDWQGCPQAALDHLGIKG
jgi:gluconate 2-dehydrogenase gamma chain